MQSLFPSVATETLTLNLDLATYETFNRGRRRLAGSVFGLAGLFLIFPLSATAVSLLFGKSRSASHAPLSVASRDDERPESNEASAPSRPGRILVLMEGFVCALAGVLLLNFFVPLKFLHMYTGDYLASLLLIFGLLLLLLNRRRARSRFLIRLQTRNWPRRFSASPPFSQ